MKKSTLLSLLIVASIIFTSCGGDSSTNSTYDSDIPDEGGSNTTYSITVVSTDSGNKYSIDGNVSPSFTLIAGSTYIFNNIPSSHPFRLSTTADGTHNGGAEYMNGVSISGNVLTLTTANNMANGTILYYYCSVHPGMGGAGKITISSSSSSSGSGY